MQVTSAIRLADSQHMTLGIPPITNSEFDQLPQQTQNYQQQQLVLQQQLATQLGTLDVRLYGGQNLSSGDPMVTSDVGLEQQVLQEHIIQLQQQQQRLKLQLQEKQQQLQLQEQQQQQKQPFLQLLTSPPKPSVPVAPSLSILEQPAQYYRFRYQSEVEGNRVGGLLLGRHADDSKSYMKLRISGIDPAVHSKLCLTVCTVSSERAPHPFYLHGDNCKDGYFKLEKTIDEKAGGCWDISFSRLAVICVSRKNKDDILRAMETRNAMVPKLHDGPQLQHGFTYGTNVGNIRLAFSLAFTDTAGQDWLVSTVYSDEILEQKEKMKSVLHIECLNPEEVPVKGSSLIAIYTATPTNGFQKNSIKVIFSFLPEDTGMDDTYVFEQDLDSVKKHLLIVRTPNVPIVLMPEAERLKCKVSVQYNDIKSKQQLSLLFSGPVDSVNTKLSGQTRKRQALD